ncbi:MAG: L-aspartate oxidase [Acidobacteriota bacterium]
MIRDRATGVRAAVDEIRHADMVVIGAGVAGLSAALGAAPKRVTVVTKTRLAQGGASVWAQGGVAVAMGSDDTPPLHAADTLAAGAGLSDRRAVALLTREGPERVKALVELGAQFDRTPEGDLALGREAAHSRRRILHAHGDATGAEMVRALAEAVRQRERVLVEERAFAFELVRDPAHSGSPGRVVGVLARHADGRLVLHAAPAVVLATGGIGHVYLHTTNPPEATGDGLAMAAHAGARMVDLEFVQFHPTALQSGADPMPLLTEALRGEGAVLLDSAGDRFMLAEHPLAELAPRDVVARAIWRKLQSGDRVVLDARAAVGERFPERFPTVFQSCMAAGIDPRREPMPVAPAAHYHMGGVAVDRKGRSSLGGLWACGEVSSTGVHGANRLASNSLLEALVFGARVAEDVHAQVGAAALSAAALKRLARTLGRHAPEGDPYVTPASIEVIRRVMWERVGLVRDGEGLASALLELEGLADDLAAVPGEAHNMLVVARLVARAALERRESRGGHYRTDYPDTEARWKRRMYVLGEPTSEDDLPSPVERRAIPAVQRA